MVHIFVLSKMAYAICKQSYSIQSYLLKAAPVSTIGTELRHLT